MQGLPRKLDAVSLEMSADYMPTDSIKERKVRFELEDREDDATNITDEVASHDGSEHDDKEESSEDQSSESDTDDTTDTSDAIEDDRIAVEDESSELREDPCALHVGELNIEQLFQQFIEVSQLPPLKQTSLDQLTRLTIVFYCCQL